MTDSPAASWAPEGARRTWGAQRGFKAPPQRGGYPSPCCASGGLTQEALQHRLNGPAGQRLLQGGRQPCFGMLLAMPPNQVAVTADLRRLLLREAPLDVGPG